MQDISRQLGALFHHILREANVIANGLPKGGVFFILQFLLMYGMCFFLNWSEFL